MAYLSLNLRPSRLPAKPATVDQLRQLFDVFGMDKIMVTLVQVDGGFHFLTHAVHRPQVAQIVKAEKSGAVRVFKSAESALRLAQSFGFTTVQVELSRADSDANDNASSSFYVR